MVIERLPEVQALSLAEKAVLAGELWELVEAQPSSFPVRPEIVELLEQRWQHHLQHPEEASPWSEVRERLHRAIGRA